MADRTIVLPQRFRTPRFRMGFPNLFTPRNDKMGVPWYTLVLLFPKSTDLSELQNAAKLVASQMWPTTKPPGLKIPFRNGDEKTVDGFKDTIFINVKSKQQPGVVGTDAKLITNPKLIYPGCWAQALLSCYAYDKQGGIGVAFGLGNIQKVADDKPFGQTTNAEDDFQAIAGAPASTTATAPVGAPAGASDSFWS